MKKQVKKWLTLILAFALILGSVKYNPLSVRATEVSNSEFTNTVTGGDAGGFDVIDEENVINEEYVPEDIETVSGNMAFDVGKVQMFAMMRNARAGDTNITPTSIEEGDKTFLAGNLKVNYDEGVTHGDADGQKRYDLTFDTQWKKFQLELGENITLTDYDAVTFAATGIEGKVLFAVQNWGTEIRSITGQEANEDGLYTIDLTSLPEDSKQANVVAVGVEGNTASCVFHGVFFDKEVNQEKNLLDTIEAGEGDVKVYGDMGINYSGIANGKPEADTLKRRTLEFGTSGEIQFNLPSPEKASTFGSVKIALSSLTGGVQVYFRDADGNYLCETQVTAEGLTELNVNSEKEMTQLVIRSNNAAATCTFDGVYFKASVDEENLLDTIEAGEGDVKVYGDMGINYSGIANGKPEADTLKRRTLEFGTSGEIQFILPSPEKASTFGSVKIALSSLTGGVQVYFRDADGNYLCETQVTAEGLTELNVNSEKEMTQLVIRSNNAAATCTFDGVYFKASVDEENLLDTIEAGEGDVKVYGDMKINYSGIANGKPEADTLKRRALEFGTSGEIQFILPSPEKASTFGSVKIALSSLTGGVQVYFRDADGNYLCETQVTAEGLTELNVNSEKEMTQLVIRSNNAAATCTFDGVYFKASVDEENLLDTIEAGEGDVKVYGDMGINYSGIANGKPEADTLKRRALEFGTSGEIQFNLPSPEKASTFGSVKIALSSLTGGVQVYFRDADGNYLCETQVTAEGLTELNVNSEEEMTQLVIRSNNAAATCTFDGIFFDKEVESEESADTYTITVYASALKHDWSETGITNTLGTDNRLKIDFGVENKDSRYDLTNGNGEALSIDLANVKEVTFNVCDQEGRHNISLSYDGEKVGDPIQNQTGSDHFVMTPSAKTGTINEVVFQAAGWDYGPGNTLTIEGVVFTMKKTADDQEDVAYGVEPAEIEQDLTTNITPEATSENDRRFTVKAGELEAQESKTVTCEAKDVEKAALTFVGGENGVAWSEIRFNLPDEIDLANAKSVTFAVSDQSVPLSYKLYDASGTEIEDLTVYHKTGKTTVIPFAGRTEKVKSVAIMLNGDDVSKAETYTCLFDGVLFIMNEEDLVTHNVSFTADELVLGERNAASCEKAGDKYVMSFAALNQEVTFQLPKTMNMENCVSVQITVSGQTGPVNYYLQLDGTKPEAHYYNTANETGIHTLVSNLTTGVNEIRIQCGGQDYVSGSGITLEKITFTMKGEDETNDYLEDEEPDIEVVPGTDNITPAGDGKDDISYQAGALKPAGATSAEYVLTDTNQYQVKFAKQYDEIKLNLADPVDLLQCTGVTFAVSEQQKDCPLAFKLYLEDGSVVPKYDNYGETLYTFPLSRTGKVVAVGVMMNEADKTDQTCVFDGVCFTMDTSLSTVTELVEFPASELTPGKTQNATYTEVNGEYVIDFSAVNSEMWFTLPETVNMANCISVIFEVSGQTQPLNFHVGTEEAKLKSYWYNSGSEIYTLEALCKNKINQVCVQLGDNQAEGTVTLKKVSFLMRESNGEDPEPDEPEEPTIEGTPNITPEGEYSYQAGTLAVSVATSAEYDKTTTNQYQVKFAKQYDEIKVNLATPIDLLQCTGVTFAVSEQSSPLAFKLYLEDGNVVPKYDNEGETLYTFPLSRTGKVVAVGVMMNEADKTDQTCVFDGVCFTVDTSLSTVTELVEFPASELTPGKTQNATYTEVNGEYVIDFSAVNSEMWFTLPETVNMANCISVIFEVSGQTQPLNFHVGTEEAKLKSYWYNSGSEIYTLEALCKNKINQVCVQLGNNQAEGTVTLKKVSFLMRESNGEEPEPDEPDEPTIEGTPNITPEGEYSYQAGTLAVSVATSAEYAKTTTNQIKADFVSQYKELKLTLPEAINLLQCKSVTFAVSEQSAPLAFKLYNDKNEQIMVKYDQTGSQLYTFDISSTEKVKYVGVMLNQKLTDVSCVFDGVVFEVDTNATTETYTVTYQAHELTLKSSEAASCQLENGNWMIKFSDRDQNVNFKLPASVNLEKCVNIIITVATQNGPMNFNVSLDSSKLKDYYYNTGNTVYTLEPGIAAKINEIGVQCGRENDEYVPGSFLELISVSFLMKGTEPKPAPADNNYTMDFLEVSTKSEGVTEVVDENGTATITFPKKDDSITYVIPDSVDTNHLTSMQFLQSLSGVRVEVLNAKGKVIASGTDSILQTNCNPDAKYIRLVSLADNTVLTLNSVKFNVDPDAFEAIVLNGKFDREDVSMWGAALWGSVDGVETAITTKTSDTPIWGDIYTYGEINRRSSPYVCFAQDVSDRTENNRGYIFSFWAKLSDDYKDAPAELRTVEFSPYFIDQNGKTNYSMYRTGAYKQVLEPGEWTHFYGVVNLPGGAQGFVIRIVEQGTNYGQGTCLMGGYAVTGVSLTPTSLAEEPNYKWGGGGNRSNTITKEATCEVTYELKDLSIDWASAKANAEKTGMRAQFTNNYDEVRLKLPRTLDMSTCAYIRLNIPAQNVPIALKLYRKGKQVDVAYYNDITGSYLMVPEYDGLIDAIGIMSLSTPNPAGAYMLADLITFGLTQEPAPEEVSNSIIINGDFADDDMSDWSAALWGDGVTITQQTASKPIYGNTYTYATYSRRTSPYQCFAQDITGRVQQNETYTFSFWARLSNDYKGAPENQRVVQFAPYTVDKNGKENYNPRLDGVYSQVLEPGVWTYFEGTYKVTNDNPISKVVVRILEQGTNYGQGDCVKGSFSVAGVQMARYIPDPPSIDEDVPNLKDAMADVFGDDFITGTAVTLDEMEDLGIEMLVNKHFNAVTIGNELKPDALFGYSNNEHTPLQTITFNGESLEVPTLYFGRAEEILDTLKVWNESHPDDPIKVRGHVLVWHSQTPEWFFREGYTVKQNADGSENYVTPEVMNLRLEWYIKTVLEHFTGEDSPYKDMFYGWDVVNEAIYNGYRTDKVSSNEPLSQSTHSANSSWWAVYQSNEFIINAFRFANQYAPADVELYYNDYNDSDNKKVVGIIKLLKDVKEAEGTRIDGMGMQGHYNMVSPTIKEIERAIRSYSEVVDKVMYTEFDMKVGGDISRDELLQKEYISQAERYHDIYVLLKNLNAEDGINISGFTVWGTVDKYSWLQSSSDVGGGASGDLTQCPLLFDSNYKVKPSYWALVDYTMVDPDWTEETAETVKEETKPETETSETPETVETPDESKPEPEPVVETNSAIEEQKKNNPALVAGIAVGAVVLGAGGGAGFYFTRKKKKITK